MKLTFLLLTLALLRTQASVVSQTITLTGKDMPIRQVFSAIEKQTGYLVVYSKSLLQQAAPVTIQAQRLPLADFLQAAFKGQPYTFQVDNKSIFVYPAPARKKTFIDSFYKAAMLLPITGIVKRADGQVLAGASIRIKGKNMAAITDNNGRFELNAEEGSILIISYVGYLQKEVKVTGKELNIILEYQDLQMDTSVVTVNTGYQNLPKERATGSFSQVNNELFNRQVSTDVISRLKGIAPSVFFDQRNGKNNLTIRGISTIFGNDQPLIVVDNFPYEGDLGSLNPNDVESLTILKDAAAASIWGARAGNGVVVITTKKGSRSGKPVVHFNSNVTVGEKPDLYYEPRMGSNDYIDMELFLFDKGYYNARMNSVTDFGPLTPVLEILKAQTDHKITPEEAAAQINKLRSYDIRKDLEKYFYRTPVDQQYALNVSGGTDKYRYYLAAGYDKNIFNKVGIDQNRITINTQQSVQFSSRLEADLALAYSQSNSANNWEVAYINGYKLYPYAQLADDNGNALPIRNIYRNSFIDQVESRGLLDWSYYPLNELRNNYKDNTSKTDYFRVAPTIRYRILQGLTAEVKYQMERQFTGDRKYQSKNAYTTRNLINQFTSFTPGGTVYNVPVGGILDQSNNQMTSLNGRAQLSYNNSFKRSNISAIGGIEVREVKNTGNSNRLYGYNPDIGTYQSVNLNTYYPTQPYGYSYNIDDGISVSKTIDRFRSYFGNAAYSYDNRYTISLSGRIDQSNLFGVATNQRAVPLWSTGLKWNLSEEKFYNISWLSMLSIRATYGFNGNIDKSVTAYTTARSSTNATGTGRNYASIYTPANPELRWEKTSMYNLGIDFKTRNNRIFGSIEYYSKRGIDLIGDGRLNPTTGLLSYRGNVAGMKGNGWDIELNTINTRGAIKWSTALLFSQVKDEITQYGYSSPYSSSYLFFDQSIDRLTFQYTPTVGKPLFSVYSYKWAGLNPQTGDPMGYLNGKPSKDYTALVSTVNNQTDSLVFHGRAMPSVFGAVRNTISFKGFTLSFNVTYRFNYYFKKSSVDYGSMFLSTYVLSSSGHSDFANRWQKPGDEAHTSIPSFVYPNVSNRDLFYSRSSILIKKGDNIRLQDLALNYEINKNLLGKLPVQRLELYCYVNNVGWLWLANKEGLDPDIRVTTSAYQETSLPRARTIAIGLKADF